MAIKSTAMSQVRMDVSSTTSLLSLKGKAIVLMVLCCINGITLSICSFFLSLYR